MSSKPDPKGLHAGFWRRAAAAFLDHLIAGTLVFLLGAGVNAAAGPLVAVAPPQPLALSPFSSEETGPLKRDDGAMEDGGDVLTERGRATVTHWGLVTWAYEITRIRNQTPPVGSITVRAGPIDPETGADLGLLSGTVAAGVGLLLMLWLCEASPLRGSPGKRLLGLMVVREDAGRVGLGRSLARTLGKGMSMLTLGIGFVMAGVTPRKQALHDGIAKTLVVRRKAYGSWSSSLSSTDRASS